MGERIWLAAGAAVALVVALLGAAAASGLLPDTVPPLGEAQAFHPLATALGLAAAAASAILLGRARRGRSAELIGPVLVATTLFTAALWSLVAIEAPTRSSKAIAAYLAPRLEPGDRVVCVGGYRQSLPFYLGRLVDSAEPHKDLAFGVSQLSNDEERRRFPTAEELEALWESGQRVYLIVDRKLERLRARGIDGGTVLIPGKRMQLVVNHPPAGG